MKKKIIGMLLTFFMAVGLIANISSAQTIADLTSIAHNNLGQFLNMSIGTMTNGSQGTPSKNRAWYCLYEQSKGGNGTRMNTAIVDLGRTGINSVESTSSSYGYVSLTTSNGNADLAAQVIYLAAKSYMNNERTGGGTQTAPYKHAMMYYISAYANSIKAAGLFNAGLNAGTAAYNEHISRYNSWAITEAQNYVNSTKSYAFSDQSVKDAQTIIEDGEWMFVGPYRIQKEGGSGGGLSSSITSVVVEGENGATYSPDGWAVNPNAGSVAGGIELPNGQSFYLAFRSNKPDSVKKVTVRRRVTGGLRARFVFCDSDGGQDLGIYGGEFSGSSEGEITLPGVPYSTIKIVKKDEDTGALLPDDVQVIAYLEGVGYVRGNNYVDNKEEATVFTSKNGVINVNNLSKTGNYTIYEIGNSNPGYLEVSLENPIKIAEATVDRIGQVVNRDATNKSVVDFAITKIDQDSKKAMPNIGFVVQYEPTGEYVINGEYGEEATFTKDISEATTYITDSQGYAKVNNLSKRGKYLIYEVINPHFGYQEVSYEQPKLVGEYNATGLGVEIGTAEVKITALNKRIYVKLSGYVWEDWIYQKNSIRNYLWNIDNDDANDERVANVNVILKKADGTIIDTRTTTTILNTDGEMEDGAYLFGDYLRDPSAKKILIEDLRGGWIEFEYNGMSYASVPLGDAELKSTLEEAGVEVSDETINERGSKATDEVWRAQNFTDNFAVIENNQAISKDGQKITSLEYSREQPYTSKLIYGEANNLKYGYEGQNYPISGMYDKYKVIANTKDANPNKLLGQDITIDQILTTGIEEVKYINLGLEQREMPDLNVTNDVYNAIVSINGYGHIYQYGYHRADETISNKPNVDVKFGTERGSQSYIRGLYESDYHYDGNPEEELEVYITYRLDITNEASNIVTRVNEISNYYDKNFGIVKIGSGINENGEIVGDDDLDWVIDDNFTDDEYARVVIYPGSEYVVEAQSSQYIYVQYSLDKETLGSILFDAGGESPTEQIMLQNVAEVDSYSSYRSVADAEENVIYEGIDWDSNPGNVTPDSIETFEDDTDKAPGMILEIVNPRTISGTVFEDYTPPETQTGEERIDIEAGLGNGIFNTAEGDTTIEGVTVTLMNVSVNADGTRTETPAQKYDEETGGWEDITATTNPDGNFTLDGFIPGNYVLRYTWGDEGYSIKDYKATVYREEDRQNRKDWYLYEYGTSFDEKTRYSDALDNYETRKAIDGAYETTYTEDPNVPTMMNSTTPDIEFGVELNDIYQAYQGETPGNRYGITTGDNNHIVFNIPKMDFGIVERARQIIDIYKRVSHINITLANGMVLVDSDIIETDGNYELEEGTRYVTFMPEKDTTSGGNGFVRAEIDNELIQGATLTITYEIVVENKSEVDYDYQRYYEYGEANPDRLIRIIPSGVYDYIDSEMVAEQNSGWEIITDKSTYGEELRNPTMLENYYYQEYKRIETEGGQVKTTIGYEEFLEQYSEAILEWNETNVTEARRSRLENFTMLNNTGDLETLPIDPGGTRTVDLVASKRLTNTDEIELDNHVEIVEVKREEGIETGRIVTPATSSLYNAGETVTITGPTGENNNYTPYIILGISSLVIVVAGIIFIKKKIIG